MAGIARQLGLAAAALFVVAGRAIAQDPSAAPPPQPSGSAGAIAGVVLKLPGGDPAAGASVKVLDESFAPTSYSVVLPGGALTLSVGRGDFRVSIAPLLNIQGAYRSPVRAAVPSSLEHAYVKSIRLGGTDVLNGGLHLDRQRDVPLEIVIGTTPGALEGVVVNDSREPIPNVTVALVPDAARRARIDPYRSATSDAAGRFRIPDVPPGDYTALAFDSVESGEWQSAEFVAPYEGRGKPVRVADGAPARVELIALPPPR